MAIPARCLVVFVPVWFAVASAQAAVVDPNDIERLLDAIARIESHCDPIRSAMAAELSTPTTFTACTGKTGRNSWVWIAATPSVTGTCLTKMGGIAFV